MSPKTLPAPYADFVRATALPTPLDADGRYPQADHAWSDAERKAVVQAWASQRPLLVRGEAGCGKSQLARAAAAVLQVPLVVDVIHPRYEASDLKYVDDPVRRLAAAQMLGAVRPDGLTAEQALSWLQQQLRPQDFIRPGPIWRAFSEQEPTAKGRQRHADWPRAVMLIDEVDKADADVPNALLDVLGQRSFDVPGLPQPIACSTHAPLIVITTNEDRELPAAFVRRCAVLNLQPDVGDEASFVDWVVQRAQAHRSLQVLRGHAGADELLRRAAAQTWADRQAAADAGLPTVGLAECLDLLAALARLSPEGPERAGELLDELSAFALVKQREQSQGRPPQPPRG